MVMPDSTDIDAVLHDLPAVYGYLVRVPQSGYVQIRTNQGDVIVEMGSGAYRGGMPEVVNVHVATVFRDVDAARKFVSTYFHFSALVSGVYPELVPIYGDHRVLGPDAFNINWKSTRNAILHGVRH